MRLPLRRDNTLVRSTGRPCSGSPPPTLQSEEQGERINQSKDINMFWGINRRWGWSLCVCHVYHRRGWSWGSSAVCRGRSAGGQSTPGWWRGRLPPSTLGSPQRGTGLPAQPSRTGNIHVNKIYFKQTSNTQLKDGAPSSVSTYSPVKCTLLFDWWRLCILLLALPSSTDQQLNEEDDKLIYEHLEKQNTSQECLINKVGNNTSLKTHIINTCWKFTESDNQFYLAVKF